MKSFKNKVVYFYFTPLKQNSNKKMEGYFTHITVVYWN